MSIENLAQELRAAQSFDITEVARKVQRELDVAASSEQRGRILSLFNMTVDQVERNLAARGDQDESLETLRRARAHYYWSFIVNECTVGRTANGTGDVSVEMLMAVTNREIAAGRMSEGHGLRRMAVEGAAAPHLSHAELVAKHAKTQSGAPGSGDTGSGSKLAYAFGSVVGRKLKGLLRD